MFETSSQYSISVARGTANRCERFSAIAGVHSAIGEASSRIQMPRPCVPRMRSFVRGWTTMSSYRVVGRFAASLAQWSPLSCVTNSARSVPAKSTLGFPVYSARPRTDASSLGRPVVTAVQVLPKSAVRKMYGAKRVERHVRRAARRRGRDDVADERAVLHALDCAAQLGPRGAAVRRELQVAIVGSDPEDLRVERRLGEVRDLADVVAIVARALA